MMKNRAPSLRPSSSAKLLLYKLFKEKIEKLAHYLKGKNFYTWNFLHESFEKILTSEADLIADKACLKQIFFHMETTTKRDLERQVKALVNQSLWFGVSPTNLLESFIQEHVGLIKSVEREYLEKTSQVLSRGIRQGLLQNDLEKEIFNITTISKKRAKLIARNAPLHYSGALTKHHQISAGIMKYRWQTSQDERVRDSHEKKNGKVFSWNDGTEHPRSEVNCRCDAVPILDN